MAASTGRASRQGSLRRTTKVRVPEDSPLARLRHLYAGTLGFLVTVGDFLLQGEGRGAEAVVGERMQVAGLADDDAGPVLTIRVKLHATTLALHSPVLWRDDLRPLRAIYARACLERVLSHYGARMVERMVARAAGGPAPFPTPPTGRRSELGEKAGGSGENVDPAGDQDPAGAYYERLAALSRTASEFGSGGKTLGADGELSAGHGPDPSTPSSSAALLASEAEGQRQPGEKLEADEDAADSQSNRRLIGGLFGD